MNRARLPLAIGGLILLIAALAWLYRATDGEVALNIAEVNAEFRKLERLDADWNTDVLRSRTGLNRSYDAVVQPLTTVDQIHGSLTATVGDLAREPALARRIDELGDLFERKTTLIDAFKSQDALLKNSMRYFPTAVTEVLNGVAKDRGNADLGPLAQDFMNRMLHAASTGDADSMAAARLLLDQLRGRPALDDVDRTGNFLRHAITVHEQLERSEAVLAEIMAIPVTARLGELGAAVNEIFEQRRATQATWRAALVALSAVLLALVFVLAWVVWRSYRRLEDAVATRTRELSNALIELKETQAQIVQTEKMSSLGQMVAGIVHEINTPVAYVKNSLQLIQMQFQAVAEAYAHSQAFVDIMSARDRDNKEARARLRQARAALDTAGPAEDLVDLGQTVTDSLDGVARITEIVNDLRNFSRLDRAAYDAFDLNKGFDSTLSIARNVVKHVQVVRDYTPVPTVWCSPSQINQVMLNLITNACQALGRDPQGTLTLRTRAHEGTVQFIVEDNGSGIPEEVLPKIFDPFFTTKKVGEGTGLGLSITRRIVDTHKGTIEVRSQPGIGTTFTVTLPVASADASAELAEAA